MTAQITREWYPYSQVAREYIGIAPDVLLGAIRRNELPAYAKPITRGRKEGAKTERDRYFVHLADVDEWIRTCWKPYTA